MEAGMMPTGASMEGFMAVYSGVIMPKCGPCHTTNAMGNLGMPNAMMAYANLINKAGRCMMMRVVPGDPMKSLLYTKVTTPGAGCGNKMPNGRTALSAAEIKMIEDWIKGP
jgi:hypothetical protein